MSFIANASHFSLGEGVYTHVHGNVVYHFHGKEPSREQITDGSCLSLLTYRAEKRRRLNEDVGIKIIRSKNLKLIREIGSGPGYLLHAGLKKGDAVIVKVFNPGPGSTVRRQLESAVTLSKGIMHPNVLRLLGMSSPESLSHFIVYESAHRQNAEGPLAVALKNDLDRSIRLGFKMIADLSAGMNHLSLHGISLGSMGVENFDIFLDMDDRFVICPHPRSLAEGDTTQEQEESAWTVFNALCQKTLMSANRVLHHDEINRDSAILDVVQSRPAASENAGESLLPSGPASASSSSKNTQEDELGIPPRREYVWRKMNRGQQSLATVASRIALDLDMNLSSLRRMTWTDGQSPHRCAGYVREEITLATTTLDSAVVAHDAPSPSELCSVCHEVVGPHEIFRCVCGDHAPGLQRTIKCQTCKLWSHSDCVGYSKNGFTCWLCLRREPSESGAEYRVTNVGTEHDDPVFFKEVADGQDTLMAATSETFFKGFPVSAPPMHKAAPIGTAVNSKFIVRRKQDVTFGCLVPGCGSTFTRSLNLKQHILSHDKGKSFVCKWPGCLKVFERHHNYKKHEQLHANYRPFTCEECKKQFMRMDGLNRHLRSKAGAECQPKSSVPCPFQVRCSGDGEYRYIASVPTGMSPTFPVDRADPAELMNELSLPRSSWFNQAAEELGEEAHRILRSGKSIMRPWASGGVATKREVPMA